MEEKFLVVVNRNFQNEETYYCGEVEILVFKKFKELPYKMKEIVKANVKMVKICGVDFIESYEIIEKIL